MKKIFFLVAFFACLSGYAQDFSQATITSLLTNGSSKSWKASKVFVLRKDVTAGLAACEMDNFVKLNADGTFVYSEGASKCTATAADVISSGTWTYDEGLHYVTFVAGSEKFIWGINATTEGILKINWTYVASPSNSKNYDLITF